MVHFSLGVRLAWEISRYEAAAKKSRFIEIDHLMLGILSLDKILSNLKNLPESELDSFLYEKDKLFSRLIEKQINITDLRRKLRLILPIGEGVPSDGVYHRSPDCKQMFEASTQFAANYLTVNHLFISIITNENSYSRNLLLAIKVDLDKLKTDLLFSFYKNN